MKKLSLDTFIKPGWLDRVVIENNNPNVFAPAAAPAIQDPFAGFKQRFGGRANIVNVGGGSLQAFKAELIKYIIQQLPNIKATYILGDLVAHNNNNFTAVIINNSNKPLLDLLSVNVDVWLKRHKDTNSVKQLLAQAKNSVPELIKRLAPEITAAINALAAPPATPVAPTPVAPATT